MYKDYTDKDKKRVALLRSLGASFRMISQETKIPETTCRDWVRLKKADVDDADIRKDKKAILETVADDCMDVAQMALERMREVVPECRSVQQLSIAAGTMIDKHNLLNGDPTQIHKLDNLAELFNAVD